MNTIKPETEEKTALTSKIAPDLETLANAHDSGSTHKTDALDQGEVLTDTMSIVFNRLVVDPTTEDACQKAELTDGAILVITNSAPEFERDKDTTSEEVKSESGPSQTSRKPKAENGKPKTKNAHPSLDVYSGL